MTTWEESLCGVVPHRLLSLGQQELGYRKGLNHVTRRNVRGRVGYGSGR